MLDTHVHSNLSCDGHASPEAIERAARRLGLSIIITDHLDTSPVEICWGRLDVLAWRALPEQPGILKGLEVSYTKDTEPRIRALLENLKPRWAIGAVHVVEGQKIEDWVKNATSIVPCLKENLNLAKSGLFNSLGHLTYFNKLTERFKKAWLAERALLEDIAHALVETGTLLEVNTAAYPPMPPEEFWGIYAEAGGELVALGSDAHRAHEVGRGFEEIVPRLAQLGLKPLVKI